MFTGTLYTLNSASYERETSISQGNIQHWIITFILQDPSNWPCLHSYSAGRAPFGKGSHLDLWLGLKVEGSWGWEEGKCFAAESTVRVKALMEKGKKGKRVNTRKSCREGTLPFQETVQPTFVVHSWGMRWDFIYDEATSFYEGN